MKFNRDDLRIIRELVGANVRKQDIEITQKEVEFFRDHPLELDRLTSTVATKKVFLVLAFILGFILVTAGILIRSVRIIRSTELFNEITANLLTECGFALWGAAITVYLLEIVLHRQEILNRQYRIKVQDRIREMDDRND
jgi:hypothetical protein